MAIVVNENPLELLYQQWSREDEGALLLNVLSFLDVKTLLQKSSVNKTCRNLCEKTIRYECGLNGPKRFESKKELRDAVWKYSKYEAESMDCLYLRISHGQM
jgi:hypothetical protein